MVWRPPKFMIITSVVGSAIGGAVLFKDFVTGTLQKVAENVRADGKVVIVTGSNTGIGKETAHDFARRGAKVYMACRNQTKCDAARKEIILDTKNKNVFCRQCDLSDFDSIRLFVNEFKKSEEKLDILVNNGGIMRCPRMVTKQGIEMQMGVNHLGHFLLTNLLIDRLKKAAPSRIVVVSSIAHTRGKLNFDDFNCDKSYDPGTAYNNSKLANVLFTKQLAERLRGTGVSVNAVHPGLVNTEIARHMGFDNSITATIFVKPLMRLFLKSPQQGAMTTLHVALEPSLQDVSGQYFSDCKVNEVADAGNDTLTAQRLWKLSEKWTRLTVSS